MRFGGTLRPFRFTEAQNVAGLPGNIPFAFTIISRVWAPMNEPQLDDLRRVATEFRSAIERSRAEKASPHLPYFPDGACRMASWLLALHLRRRGEYAIRFETGHIPGCEPYVRHAWLVVDGQVVDITADPFGEAPVVVGAPTRFHESLGAREEQDAVDGIAAFTPDEAARYRRWLGPIEARMPGFTLPAD